ncbi:MAG TPA: nucleotidyltransferase [Bdellovibrionales bacterium]|nr:nucleotidyltransferase [Pseudobdellovibrionaceae bacterium]HAG91064.1 nucleotidyltransferase [Bdellovibrionales bacterium]|tara:strand:+ start:132 stop:434 length:303 start_codon:yes stop_codon:yes gene_type:complete
MSQTLESIKNLLRDHSDALSQFKVAKLYIFGSFAKGYASEKSDIDILVEFLPDAKIGFFEFLNLQYALEDILKRKVDLVSKDGIHPALKNQILDEAVDVA